MIEKTRAVEFRNLRLFHRQAGREKARQNRQLHLAGCMLYWAEGTKKKSSVQFVNSDPNMLIYFMRFLREELDVPNSDIRITVICHTPISQEQAQLEQFWLNLLELPYNCLGKTQLKKGTGTRRNVLKFGMCTISVRGSRYLHHILGAIQEYGGFENPDWLF